MPPALFGALIKFWRGERTVTIDLRRGDLSLAFVGTVTVFSAPHEAALEELRIESFFPRDARTAATCQRLLR